MEKDEEDEDEHHGKHKHHEKHQKHTKHKKGSEDKDSEGRKLNEEIVNNALQMRQLVDEKAMGLPHLHSEMVRQFADQILMQHHHHSVHDNEIYNLISMPPSPSSSEPGFEDLDRKGQEVIKMGRRSQTIINMLGTAKNKKSGDDGKDKGKATTPVVRSEAAEHLERMVKKLHCRHRKLIRLAEEIIAKRWKLSNMEAAKDGKDVQAKGEMTAMQFTDRRMQQRRKKRKKKASLKPAEIQTLYQNPMAKLKVVGQRCGSSEGWKQEDPLVQALNRVGVSKMAKCSEIQPDDVVTKPESDSKKKHKKKENPKVEKIEKIEKKAGNFSDVTKPTVEAHFNHSALTIFVSNYSHLNVAPSKENTSMKVERSTLTNDFVDLWKRRSYSVGIILIILTALLQCIYLCGPRMGDNYVTHAMVSGISGIPWTAPVGIYGILFLGYLFGGMMVIKTASAVEHSQTVKEYFMHRKSKFFIWYGLALYFLVIFVFRSYMWYIEMVKADKEIKDTFRKPFYYNQLPGRLLYTQFLIKCCGANGPSDYPNGPTIGWPKSCYTGVTAYHEYYELPKPVEYGCTVRFYKYTTIAMSILGFLILLIWILILIHPIYLYVYELFICLKSKEPDPWLVKVN